MIKDYIKKINEKIKTNPDVKIEHKQVEVRLKIKCNCLNYEELTKKLHNSNKLISKINCVDKYNYKVYESIDSIYILYIRDYYIGEISLSEYNNLRKLRFINYIKDPCIVSNIICFSLILLYIIISLIMKIIHFNPYELLSIVILDIILIIPILSNILSYLSNDYHFIPYIINEYEITIPQDKNERIKKYIRDKMYVSYKIKDNVIKIKFISDSIKELDEIPKTINKLIDFIELIDFVKMIDTQK